MNKKVKCRENVISEMGSVLYYSGEEYDIIESGVDLWGKRCVLINNCSSSNYKLLLKEGDPLTSNFEGIGLEIQPVEPDVHDIKGSIDKDPPEIPKRSWFWLW